MKKGSALLGVEVSGYIGEITSSLIANIMLTAGVASFKTPSN